MTSTLGILTFKILGSNADIVKITTCYIDGGMSGVDGGRHGGRHWQFKSGLVGNSWDKIAFVTRSETNRRYKPVTGYTIQGRTPVR